MPDIFSWKLLAAALVVLAVPKVIARVQLSRAKHRSLAGHSRMASRIARSLRGYTYGDDQFFRADEAPADIAARRRTAFSALAASFAEKQPQGRALTAAAMPLLPDLQLTAAYRVPFPFSAKVAAELPMAPFARAVRGTRLIDVDGNEAIDLTGAYGVNVFGNDFYKQTLADGIKRTEALGTALGYYHPLVLDNARRLAAISGLEEVSFHMSGTEAVMQAVRVARYNTRRTHVVRFCGAYHGWWGDVQPGPGNPLPADTTYTLKDMDARSLAVIRSRRDIACVLVNPLQALHPNSPAPGDSSLMAGGRRAHFDHEVYANWLRDLRQACTDNGVVLIFDEVFMGFRLARGGAQAFFGIQADLVTYGKTVGGGLPVGVVCGRREFMRRFKPERPADLCFARGTFNAHPAVMGTMASFLDALEAPAIQALYEDSHERWSRRAAQLNTALAAAALPVQVANLGSVWTVLYTVPSRYNWMFQYYLRSAGLALSWVGSGRLVFSLDFTDADFAEVQARFLAAARRMQDDGWWWTPPGVGAASVRWQLLREMLRMTFHA